MPRPLRGTAVLLRPSRKQARVHDAPGVGLPGARESPFQRIFREACRGSVWRSVELHGPFLVQLLSGHSRRGSLESLPSLRRVSVAASTIALGASHGPETFRSVFVLVTIAAVAHLGFARTCVLQGFKKRRNSSAECRPESGQWASVRNAFVRIGGGRRRCDQSHVRSMATAAGEISVVNL
jgi:hypothetical protein